MSSPVSGPASGPPIIFDPARRAARLRRARHSLLQADFLHRRAADNAVNSLEVILREFVAPVDLSPHPGVFAQVLADSPAQTRVGPVQTPATIEQSAAPGAGPLPLIDGEADLIVNLLGLHWANDLPGALSQIRHALKPDGLFVASLFGAATLKELRAALTEAELEIHGGAQARVSPFADGYDGAGLLQRAGFALPVSDVDRFTVRYSHPLNLMRDLRAMGETNALAGPIRPLSRQAVGRAMEIYARRHAEPDGRIPATFEMVHLAGWAPHESQQKPARRGSAQVSLADALHTRAPGKGEAG